MPVERRTRGRWVLRLGAVVGVAIGAPVAIGVGLTVVRLVSASHPVLGWPSVINSDAEAFITGQGVFNDPNTGYTGMFFTPLFPLVLAGLLKIVWWEGWGTLLSILAGLALAAMAARLARSPRPAAEGRVGLLEAAGIGALAWSFVATLGDADLYQGRPDQPAWALAIGGLLLVPSALRGSRRRLLAAVLLLSAALWTKQTTLSLVVGVVIVAVAHAARHRDTRAQAVRLVLALCALNALALAAFAVSTDGWGPRWTIGLVGRFPVFNSLDAVAPEFARDLALVVVFALGVWVLVRLVAPRRPSAGLLPALLLVGAVATAAGGIWGRRLEGSSDHNYIGTAWCLAMLGAIAYRTIRVERPEAAWALVVVLSATALIPGSHWFSLRRGAFVPSAMYPSMPDALVSYAAKHQLYIPERGDLAARDHRPVFPSLQHLLNVVEGGYRPGFFVDALVGRRFGVIYRFDERVMPFADPHGAFEDNFLWKLNQVIAAEYQPSDATPAHMVPADDRTPPRIEHGFVPRAGTDPAPWMRHCFGPFAVQGAVFDIGRGGGFWCYSGQRLVLRATPAAVSEIVSREPMSARRIVVTLPRRSGSWRLEGGRLGNAALDARVAANGLRVSLTARGRRSVRTIPAADLHRTRGALTLQFVSGPAGLQAKAHAPAALTIAAGRSAATRLVFQASGTSRAAIGFPMARAAR